MDAAPSGNRHTSLAAMLIAWALIVLFGGCASPTGMAGDPAASPELPNRLVATWIRPINNQPDKIEGIRFDDDGRFGLIGIHTMHGLAWMREDDDLIVVMKPAGMVVHPAPGTPGGTLVNALLHHFGGKLSGVGGVGRPGIVHRIDKDTSGLLVIAKSDRAHHGLAEQFAAHSVERIYHALVHGHPDTGDPRLRGVRGVSMEPGAVIRITSGSDVCSAK